MYIEPEEKNTIKLGTLSVATRSVRSSHWDDGDGYSSKISSYTVILVAST